ncbi:hypothetical protein BGY98DRAFT_99360 [Russula aff. rugulosa BPL654]|nr:hypothetical protein BGY98DRAFT_99360 [Russula aff. rugulosa BPL654]
MGVVVTHSSHTNTTAAKGPRERKWEIERPKRDINREMTINGHRGKEEGRHDALNPNKASSRLDGAVRRRGHGDIIKSRRVHEAFTVASQKSGIRGRRAVREFTHSPPPATEERAELVCSNAVNPLHKRGWGDDLYVQVILPMVVLGRPGSQHNTRVRDQRVKRRKRKAIRKKSKKKE